MAKKQYTRAKVAILALASAAVVSGTAWLSSNGEPAAADTAVTVPGSVPTSSVTIIGSSAASTTLKPPQAAAPRAKKSRAS